jgi:hypothetical protein
MEVIARVFENHDRAVEALRELSKLGISEKRLALLAPGHGVTGKASSVPVSDSEDPGMGTAMGAAVGGAMGAAGGATLGLAAATLLVPGVGPVIAFGLVGAALLGASGAAIGATVGDTLEEGLGEGFPHEDIYLFEDALRQGKSVLVVYAEEGDEADRAREIVSRAGALNLDTLRDQWWNRMRDQEATHCNSEGIDFKNDELSYRRGFTAAMKPEWRGKSYSQCESELRDTYTAEDLNPAFRKGYDRGWKHQSNLTETHKA